MHVARGCRGGAAPRCRSLCCRSSRQHFSVCAQPVAPRPQRRAVHSSALRLNRHRRPRSRSWRRWLGAKACAPTAGFRCAPPVPSRAVPRVAVGGRRALRQAPAIPLFRVGGGWLLRSHSAAAAPRALRQAPAIPLFRVGGGWLLRSHSAAAAPRARSCCGQQR